MQKLRKRKISAAITMALVLALLLSNVALAAKPLVIKSPLQNEVVSGVYTVTGGGKGDPVEISISGGAWMATVGGKSWTYDWDTTAYANGPYTITVRYVGDTSTVSVDVSVDNGGFSCPINPKSGEGVIKEF